MIGRGFIISALVLCFCLTVSAKIKAITDLDPTVILISIDGFRADYLKRYNPKNLNRLAKNGVRAKWMTPSFPTKTFPNHYTVATGLVPENHGIIANNMYDPEFDSVFKLSKREEVQNQRWWGGEPIWVTAEKQGQIAGAFFFPGTEAPIGGKHPTYWKTYDGGIPNEKRVDTILSWIDLPKKKRPTIFTLYFSDIDDAGHDYSPESKKTGKAVKRIDKIIGRLTSGLSKRGVLEAVNLIIVSDHGMAEVDQRNVVILDEMFDTSLAKQILWVSEITQIFPKEGKEDEIYNSIKSKLPPEARIYRKSEVPARFRYRNHRRIAPLLVLPKPGWRVASREYFERTKARDNLDAPKGSHGYDNEHPSMRALFIARGPAFKQGYVAKPFKNVEVYNLMCKILGLKPAENDGDFENVSEMLVTEN